MGKVSTKGNVAGVDKKIPFFERFIFSSTTGIATFYFMMVSTWLLFYYTDVMKISLAYVGAMFVVVRILDAIITPAFGIFLDRQNSKWGRYKPWILIIWIGMAVGGFLTFMPVNLGVTGKTVYATITYTFFSIFLSMNTSASMGMTSAISKRQDDRMMISVTGFIWILVFSSIVVIGALPLMNLLGNGDQGAGFKNFMFIGMMVSILLTLFIVKVIKERFILTKEEQADFSFKLVVETLLKNKYALITIVYVLALNLTNAIRAAVGIYYYKYYFNDPNIMVVIGGLSMLPMFLGVFLSTPLTKKIGLKNNMLLMITVTIITSVAMFFVPATASGKILFYVLYIIGSLFMGLAQPAQGTMMPNAIDYGEWKFKSNSGGFFGALSGFVQTMATAISGGVTAMILAFVNYVPDVQQTATSLNGIKFMMSILPAMVFLLGFVMLKWDMTEEKHKEIIKELNERRESQSNAIENI